MKASAIVFSLGLTFLCVLSGSLSLAQSGTVPPSKSGPRVASFVPQGKVGSIRQVAVRFSEAMIAFGSQHSEELPFEIACAAKGGGRWVDQKNWVYDFEEDLPAGLKCTFSLRKELKTSESKALGGTKSFSFQTGGPMLEMADPSVPDEEDDDSVGRIAEDQVFLLRSTGDVDEKSLLARLRFQVSGIASSVGVRLISGDEKSALLQNRGMEDAAGRVWAVQALQVFPAGRDVTLVWGRGIKSPQGIGTETDQKFHYKVRIPFKADINCERLHSTTACLPLGRIRVSFSAPLSSEIASGITLSDESGRLFPQRPAEAVENLTQYVVFPAPFPARAKLKLSLPSGQVLDDTGRPLENLKKFPLTIETSEFPPLAKFPAGFGIVEFEKEGAFVPVTLRNLEPEVISKLKALTPSQGETPSGQVEARELRVTDETRILRWLAKLERRDEWKERENSIFSDMQVTDLTTTKLSRPNGAKAFEVMGLKLDKPGFYLLELESLSLGSSLLDKPAPMFVPTAVLATRLGVHFKWGRDSGLVWVTNLADATPVKNAEVSVSDCHSNLLASGRTNADGVLLTGRLPQATELKDCGDMPALFAFARLGDDMSFVTSRWDDGIEPWRFNLQESGWNDNGLVAHTVLARSLLRQGDAVQMKHFMRSQVQTGFALPAAENLPDKVIIRHLGNYKTYTLPLVWQPDGSAESLWQVPEGTALGAYDITLARGNQLEIASGEFRVEAFRVPLMQASIKLPNEPLIAAPAFSIDVSLSHLSGGPAAGLPLRFRSSTERRYVSFEEDLQDFSFDSGAVRTGRFGSEDNSSLQTPAVATQDLVLDAHGAAVIPVTVSEKYDQAQNISTEIEFRDPNGESQTVSRKVPLWPAGVLVGMKSKSWIKSGRDLSAEMVVVDTAGKILPGVPVEVKLFEQKTFSHRKRLVGGFYAYESSYEVSERGSFCSGVSDSLGRFSCKGQAPSAGQIILQARVQDAAGRSSYATSEIWISSGDGDGTWFEPESDNRIDLLPERRQYEPGETARFQVRMPFREATALVSVEREGVQSFFVKKLSGEQPVIEIPVEPDYAPNIYVSVLALRGRVSDPEPGPVLDLGKPAFKLGIAEIKVGWKAHRLEVSLKSDREVYRVRERAKVHVSVKTADGTKLEPGAEVALAAVDEGLLELMPNTSWGLLEAMMGRRSYWVKNFTAAMKLTGKRQFGSKALPGGSGGGKSQTRELFDTLLLWQGRVELDARGQADIEVPLNDSLTAFRVVAIASSGQKHFGTGAVSIRSSADLIVQSALTPLVREGDTLQAVFSLRNTTLRPMALKAGLKLENVTPALPEQELLLAAGESREVSWQVKVPQNLSKLNYLLESSENGKLIDRLQVSQKVIAAVPVTVWQATIEQPEATGYQLAVQKPTGALDNRGGLRVSLLSSLGSGIGALEEYMKAYPYSCLEQKVSRAVVLQDKQAWEKILRDLPQYMNSSGLLCYFPGDCNRGSEVLTAYLLSTAHEAGVQIESALLSKMTDGLLDFVSGRGRECPSVVQGDLQVRKLSALEALARYQLTIHPQFAAIPDEPALLPTSALLDWVSILARGRDIPDAAKRLEVAKTILRTRFDLQGTTLSLSGKQGSLWWLMNSEDLTVLKALALNFDFDWAGCDAARLMRGALLRQKSGRWDLTTANAWGVLALRKFAARYESTPPDGESSVSLGDRRESLLWAENQTGKTFDFPWPDQPKDLAVSHQGNGRPWLMLQSLAAVASAESTASGYSIRREVLPLEQKVPGRWSTGDILSVKLEINAQAERTWVVVNDPIPAGSSILGGGLRRDTLATAASEAAAQDDFWSTAHADYLEKSFESYRAYYEFLPKGVTTIEYKLRLNSAGEFQLPGTRVEAMYSPEMFGQLGMQTFSVSSSGKN